MKVQFSSRSTLEAFIRYSFPMQQHWQLYRGLVFQYSNTGSHTQVHQFYTAILSPWLRDRFPVQYRNTGNFTQVQFSSTEILGAFLGYSFFCIFFFWRARVCRPLLCLCRPFMIFEGCLYSNPEYCRSKLARYRLSHPWPIPLISHPSLWVQFSSTSILPALLRYSFQVQRYCQLYLGSVSSTTLTALLRYSNAGSFSQAQLYWKICSDTTILAVLLRYGNTRNFLITVKLSYINRYSSSVQHYWRLCSSTLILAASLEYNIPFCCI